MTKQQTIENYLDMKNWVWMGLMCLLWYPAAQAQPVMNLKECLQIGIENNYDLRISRNEQRVSDNNLSLGNAGFLPVWMLLPAYRLVITIPINIRLMKAKRRFAKFQHKYPHCRS
jgi:hypothetical protein